MYFNTTPFTTKYDDETFMRLAAPALSNLLEPPDRRRLPGRHELQTNVEKLVSLFASLLAIPLACQCCLHAALFTGLQIVGVTLNFLDNVLLLYLPLKPAQRVFERLAFLYANLCQEIPPPNPPNGLPNDTELLSTGSKMPLIFCISIDIVQYSSPFFPSREIGSDFRVPSCDLDQSISLQSEARLLVRS